MSPPREAAQAAEPAVDHRRAIAERNAAAILDATERLLSRSSQLSMSAIAAEAGVSRPTLYAHFKTLADVVEAAVERSVLASVAAFEAARSDDGPAAETLRRMAEVSWSQLGRFDALARNSLDYLSPDAALRSHEHVLVPLRALVERGRREGAFRTDVPAEWLVSMFFTIMHGAYGHAGTYGIGDGDALDLVTQTLADVFGVSPDARR
jgi:AcrR family transcriptional regulator